MPLSDLRIKASRRFFLTRSPALTGTGVGAITSTITVGYSKDKDQPDNSHLSPDKYKVLDITGSPRHSSRYPAFFDAVWIARRLSR